MLKEKRRERKRLKSLSLRDLQSEDALANLGQDRWAPTLASIYGYEAEAWFETLMERTFEQGVPSSEDYGFLRHQYVRLLKELKVAFQEGWAPEVWQRAITQLTGPAAGKLSGTLGWLHKQCEQQAEYVRANALEDQHPLWGRLDPPGDMSQGDADKLGLSDLFKHRFERNRRAADRSAFVGQALAGPAGAVLAPNRRPPALAPGAKRQQHHPRCSLLLWTSNDSLPRPGSWLSHPWVAPMSSRALAVAC